MDFKRVDLPQPLGPITHKTFPRLSSNSDKIGSPNLFFKPEIFIRLIDKFKLSSEDFYVLKTEAPIRECPPTQPLSPRECSGDKRRILR